MSTGFTVGLRGADQIDRGNRQLAIRVCWGMQAIRAGVCTFKRLRPLPNGGAKYLCFRT